MSSRFATTEHAAPSRKNFPATPIRMRPAVPADEAASDAAATPAFAIFGDPLWGIAIASIILFAVLAALIAFG
jgi:hypothetical protein